jgi:hypothetical protein
MAGILDDTPVGVLDPRSMALTQMGMSLLGSSGPSLTPTSFGQNLGQAGMQGVQAFQQANQANQQQQLFALKMAEVKRTEAERVKKEAAMAQLLQDPRFANMGPLLQVAPQQAIERAFPKDNKPVVVAPGSALVDPEKPNAPLYTAPTKPEKPSNIAEMIAERDALPTGHPNRAIYDQAIKKATSHNPVVTVDTRQETSFGKKVGEELGEQYSGLMRADMNAPTTIAKYERLGSLLSSVGTGKFTGTTVQLKAAAKSAGINLESLGIADNVAPAQAAKQLINQLALEMRNPSAGAGMPGAMSDKDREFLVETIPSLENDPTAWPQMIDYRKRLAKRDQQVARAARAYRQKHGGKFDEGFFDELQDWSNKNPLFPEAGKAGFELSPEGAAALKKYGG